ncbi:MAG: triose-phosphate isomerase [Gemmatimonadota bacterium]
MAVIAGNWKLHHGPAATRAFFSAFSVPEAAAGHEFIVFPPALSLAAAAGSPDRDPRVQLGIQNVYSRDEGAFTGENSAAMAVEAGAAFALIGHSERRHIFGETDAEVAAKARAALRNGLVPVICVGETLEERSEGRVEEVILRQLDAVLPVLGEGRERFLLAYEPVWAIGTGETATPADASAAHATLREALERALGPARAARVAILYGGSVKPANASDLLSAPEVDGVLVGGASLEPESFAAIAAAAVDTTSPGVDV